MEITRADLDQATRATGMVVAIDVLRAFTTQAYAFAAGASEIVVVGEVEEALALRDRHPEVLLMGEIAGRPIDGFDLGNSPSALVGRNLGGRRLVHRTTAGTQGIVRATRAAERLAASLCCLGATVRWIRSRAPSHVTLVQTGQRPDGGGDEDIACADAIEGQLRGTPLAADELRRRVRASRSGRRFDGSDAAFPLADLTCAIAIDRFHFALVVERRDGLDVVRPVPPPDAPGQPPSNDRSAKDGR